MSHYLIVGQGGIGRAVAARLKAEGERVTVVTRQPVEENDVIQFNALADFFDEVVPDFVINTIGVLHDADHKPEKNINQLTEEWLQESIHINTLPTALVVQQLVQVMKPDTQIKFMTISARVSSISDNRLGGWYSYRMSKAALNMLVKNIAIEWSRQFPQSAIYAYHPGTVDSALSKPFQSNVPPENLFSPEQAAEYLLTTLDQLKLEDSGNLFDWQGKQLEF